MTPLAGEEDGINLQMKQNLEQLDIMEAVFKKNTWSAPRTTQFGR
jgi:hypothetical protein